MSLITQKVIVSIILAFLASFQIFGQEAKYFRLYSLNQHSLGEFFLDGVKFSSGTRATKYEDQLIIYNRTLNNYQRFSLNQYLDSNIDLIEIDLSSLSICDERSQLKEVFLAEAWSAVNLIEKSHIRACTRMHKNLLEIGYPELAKNYSNCKKNIEDKDSGFYQLLKSVKVELSELEQNLGINRILDEKLKVYQEQMTLLPRLSSVEQVEFAEKMIFKTLNPRGKSPKLRLKDELIIVPITLDWIQRHPLIHQWYLKYWNENGLLDVWTGGSGEGVQEGDDAFPILQQAFIELTSLVKKEVFTRSENSSHELRWINSMTPSRISAARSIVFIHDKTWMRQNLFKNQYIPIDQSMSCFRSDSLISTIIHEINVNTHDFFPVDTHAQFPKSHIAFSELSLAQLDFLTSRQSYIQLIYLDYILKL